MRTAFVVMVLTLLAAPVMAEGAKGALKTKKEKTSYFIGIDMGKRMKSELDKQSIEYDPAVVGRAVKDALAGNKSAMSDDEIEETRQSLQKELSARNQERTKALSERNRKEGEAYLAANKKKEGVVTTASGLQYKVITEGKGRSPGKTDTVTVNYRGMLIDGTEFDSSLKRGKPATFSLDQVVTGWAEALMLMKEGAKWQIVLPSSLAYGPLGTPGGPIGPHAVLVFEIELLSVTDTILLNMPGSPAVPGQ